MPKKLLERTIAPMIIIALFLAGLYFVSGSVPSSCGDNLCGYFFDVGQGDAALITRNNNQILIDGGPDKNVLAGLGEAMPPFDQEIEAIVITHPHADHIAGLNYVLDRYRVSKIYLTGQSYQTPDYETLLAKIKKQNIPIEQSLAGQKFVLSGIEVEFLWPPQEGINTPDPNSASAVAEVRYLNSSWLFLGDLPEVEQDMMLRRTRPSKSDVIKVAHHGSKNGMSEELLKTAQPNFAVISVGLNNKFGHPASSVLSKLSNINTLRTDQKGTIKMMSDGKNTSLLH